MLKWTSESEYFLSFNFFSSESICNSYIPSAREVSDLKVKGA